MRKLDDVKGGRKGKASEGVHRLPLPPPPPSDHASHANASNLREDLGTALRQNRSLHKELKELKEEMKELQEKGKRSREINSELKK